MFWLDVKVKKTGGVISFIIWNNENNFVNVVFSKIEHKFWDKEFYR